MLTLRIIFLTIAVFFTLYNHYAKRYNLIMSKGNILAQTIGIVGFIVFQFMI